MFKFSLDASNIPTKMAKGINSRAQKYKNICKKAPIRRKKIR